MLLVLHPAVLQAAHLVALPVVLLVARLEAEALHSPRTAVLVLPLGADQVLLEVLLVLRPAVLQAVHPAALQEVHLEVETVANQQTAALVLPLGADQVLLEVLLVLRPAVLQAAHPVALPVELLAAHLEAEALHNPRTAALVLPPKARQVHLEVPPMVLLVALLVTLQAVLLVRLPAQRFCHLQASLAPLIFQMARSLFFRHCLTL
jgi:hypothetical protein